MKSKVKEKILNMIIVLIVVSLYIFVFTGIYSHFRERKRREMTADIIHKVNNVIKNYTENEEQTNIPDSVEVISNNIKYTVLGKLKINKINLNEPILKENTKSALDTALVKISGPSLNSYGNVSIGGHNFMRGNYFIKIMKLNKGDIVTVTDLSGKSIDYFVYDFMTTTVDDASYLKQPEKKDERFITLVTCTKGGKERYIVKAKEKNK